MSFQNRRHSKVKRQSSSSASYATKSGSFVETATNKRRHTTANVAEVARHLRAYRQNSSSKEPVSLPVAMTGAKSFHMVASPLGENNARKQSKLITKEEARHLSHKWFETHFDDDDDDKAESGESGIYVISEEELKTLKNDSSDKQYIYDRLLSSCQGGEAKRLYMLLELYNKLDVIENYNEIVDSKGCSLMSIAASDGYNDMLRMLHGMTNININQQNAKGYTTLSIACFYGKLETVTILLSMGADVKLRNHKKQSCLVVAANKICKANTEETYCKYLNICKVLIERTEQDWQDGRQYIDEYTKADHQDRLITDDRSRVIIQEWIKSKGKMKDLFFPPFDMYKYSKDGTNLLRYFFKKSHKQVNYFSWLKIIILLAFIVYDLSNGSSHNIPIYIGLYGLAYFL